MLVVVCGVPGTGKTTVAELVADRLDAALLRTDVVRQDVVDDPTYTDAERQRVYDALFERARERLQAGETVVLDGTFSRDQYRRAAMDLAADCGVDRRVLRVRCDPEVARTRVAERTDDESEADVDVYEELRQEFESLALDHEVVDNSGTLAATESQVDALF
jgi:predicted kinase